LVEQEESDWAVVERRERMIGKIIVLTALFLPLFRLGCNVV
jgi:hypothetical protein